MKHSTILPIQIILVLLLTVSACNNTLKKDQSEIKVLVVAGGHSFDTTEFVRVFETMKSISFDTLMQPHANQLIADDLVSEYDVYVFYDMWPQIDSNGQAGYMNLIDLGKGFVFLHHSLCSYQDWEKYDDIVGGRYYTEWSGVPDSLFSTYKHDINIDVSIASKTHPITVGMQDFSIHDEGYGNIQVNDNVEILFTSDHPDCSDAMGWVNGYGNSQIVYLMFGHDSIAFENLNFQKMLENSILFVSHHR